MECDSQFAWTKEMDIAIPAKQDKAFHLYISTDDLNNYIYPIMIVTAPVMLDHISIKNITDNQWETTIDRIFEGEIITIDSLHQTISSSRKRLIADDFNMHFPRFVPDKNTFVANQDVAIRFKYVLPRKVGFV